MGNSITNKILSADDFNTSNPEVFKIQLKCVLQHYNCYPQQLMWQIHEQIVNELEQRVINKNSSRFSLTKIYSNLKNIRLKSVIRSAFKGFVLGILLPHLYDSYQGTIYETGYQNGIAHIENYSYNSGYNTGYEQSQSFVRERIFDCYIDNTFKHDTYRLAKNELLIDFDRKSCEKKFFGNVGADFFKKEMIYGLILSCLYCVVDGFYHSNNKYQFDTDKMLECLRIVEDTQQRFYPAEY